MRWVATSASVACHPVLRSSTIDWRLVVRSSTAVVPCISSTASTHQTFSNLCHLRRDHDLAEGDLWIPAVVFLVLRLGLVELGSWYDLGHDRLVGIEVPDPAIDHLSRDRLLLLVVVEDRGAILWPDIGALPVEGRRVVDREEDIEQLPVGGPGRIVLESCRLGVSRRPRRDILVARVREVSTGIARGHRLDAIEEFEDRL